MPLIGEGRRDRYPGEDVRLRRGLSSDIFVPFTGATQNVDLGTFSITTTGVSTASRFVSSVAIGTAPFTVTSTTLVTNLNADTVDGIHAAALVPYTGATANLDLGIHDFLTTNGSYTSAVAVTSGNKNSFTGTLDQQTSVDATAYVSGLQFTVRPTIDAGITQSGTSRGVVATVLRNYNADMASDDGTLANLYGMAFDYGHYNSLATCGITGNVYGLWFRPYARKGTITSLIDIYLQSLSTGGTVTSRYSIYQQDTTTRNFFGSKIGVGTITNPLEQIHVNDTVRADTVFNLNGADGLTATITLAKITPGGADGSLTFTGGILTAKADPT